MKLFFQASLGSCPFMVCLRKQLCLYKHLKKKNIFSVTGVNELHPLVSGRKYRILGHVCLHHVIYIIWTIIGYF